MKSVCGVEIQGNDAIFVRLEGSQDDFRVSSSKPLKITLGDHQDQGALLDFQKSLEAYFQAWPVDRILIKSGSTGRFSSGPSVFKIESLIQLTAHEVTFISGQTLAAYWKGQGVDEGAYGLKKYQVNAFKLAYKALS